MVMLFYSLDLCVSVQAIICAQGFVRLGRCVYPYGFVMICLNLSGYEPDVISVSVCDHVCYFTANHSKPILYFISK